MYESVCSEWRQYGFWLDVCIYLAPIRMLVCVLFHCYYYCYYFGCSFFIWLVLILLPISVYYRKYNMVFFSNDWFIVDQWKCFKLMIGMLIWASFIDFMPIHFIQVEYFCIIHFVASFIFLILNNSLFKYPRNCYF